MREQRGRVEVTLPLRTRSLTNQREHWAKRHRRSKQERGVAALVLRAHEVPGLPLEVELVRVAPRRLDSDNLTSSLKAVRDGVADWLGVDDGDERVRWTYGQRKGEPRQYLVEIAVTREVILCRNINGG